MSKELMAFADALDKAQSDTVPPMNPESITAWWFRKGWQAATLKANQWRPIADAIEGVLVVCCWVDKDDGDMRHNFDYLEDGVWQNYFNEHEHYLIAGAASGRSEDAPYTYFIPLPLPPTGTEQP